MLIIRLLAAMFLLAAAAFCVFGFLATFEPPGWLTLRIIYAAAGLAAVGGAAWIVRGRRDGSGR